MKGFRVWGLGISLISIFVFLYPIPYTLYPTHAADSTPSSEVKSQLEQLKLEIASKAAKLKNEINKKITNKAYAGVVKIKSDTSITISSKNGAKIISVNEDSEFVSKVKGRTKFSLTSLKEEDFIAGLGDIDESGVLTAKRIILLPTPTVSKKTYLFGQVVTLSEKLITIKIKNLKTISVNLPKGSDVKLNDFVILTGNLDENGIFNGEFVYVVPQAGMIKLKPKTSIPSATATSSAKPKSSTR